MADMNFQGKWWLPGKEGRSSPGSLDFQTQHGGTLTIAGSLLTSSEEEPTEVHELAQPSSLPDRIFGLTGSGDLATLLNPLMAGKESTASGHLGPRVDNETYSVPLLYFGEHIRNEPKIRDLTFTFPGLHQWTGKNLVRQISDREKLKEVVDSNQEIEVGYSVAEPDYWESTIGKCKIGLFTGVSRERSGDSTELSEATSISLQPAGDYTFPELREEYVRPLQCYFTMALGKPVHPIEISATYRGEKRSEIKIYPRFTHYDGSIKPDATDFNFRWSDINLGESLQNWFEHSEMANSLHRYYFGHRYNDRMYLEFEFLSLVVALESYHETVVDSPKVIPKKEFKNILEDIEEVLPLDSEIETRVMNLLRPIGNQHPLKTQLNHVLGEYEEMLDSLIDIDKTSSDANTIRNKIAHGYATPDTDKMISCLPNLKAVVDTILLDTIGLQADHIQQALDKNYGYQLNGPQPED
jgi:hypothetical protein